MTVVAELQIPASDTLFAETVESAPSIEMTLEQVVKTNGVPIWFGGVSKRDVEEALEATTGVERYELLKGREEEWLYSLDCEDDAFEILPSIVETGGTVLTATCSDGTWRVKLRYTDRDKVSETIDRLTKNGMQVTLTAIRTISPEDVSEVGLTEEQLEALELAIEHGYFEIPRQISLQDLSKELDISHQSLSERLRRAQKGMLTSEFTETDTSSSSEITS